MISFMEFINESKDFSKYLDKNGKLKEQDLDDTQNELYLFIKNNGQLYRSRIQPIEKNLTKKIEKGQYNSALAPQIYVTCVDDGAKMYCKEFGGKWNSMFSPKDREIVAVQMAYEFEYDNL